MEERPGDGDEGMSWVGWLWAEAATAGGGYDGGDREVGKRSEVGCSFRCWKMAVKKRKGPVLVSRVRVRPAFVNREKKRAEGWLAQRSCGFVRDRSSTG